MKPNETGILKDIKIDNIQKEGEEKMNNSETLKDYRQRLILVTDWNKYFDYPTLGGLRALIFNADKNGFNKVIRRIQSRVLINVEDYFNWVDEINGMA